ncbi:MAG: cell envelope-related transcriptional attenuator [Microgenomates group bacterium GW2011_GWC1_38_12]|nr:MAG: cell envelope-related transcriptional attenuator [Microgenomates group bacterium GW2011_GWC1_38_12]
MEELEEIQSSFEKEKFIPETKVDKRKISFSRLKRRVLRHVWMIRGSVIFFVILVLFLALLLIKSLVIKSGADYYLGLARDFVFTPRDKIKIFDGRTNILVLGKGDVGHEAPDLTDTMILVSVDHQSHKVNLISLPRDIWITTLRTKLNSTYYWGNKKQPPAQRASGLEGSGGMILAKSSVEEIVGQPVHYALVLDFSGFKKIIDVLGGVEVDVERSFSDEKYPIPGREDDLCNGDPEFKCRYETLNFVQGKQFMDGETALKFVRSRNAIGDQGTDFARQVRQQKVITAIKDKLLSKEILLSPKKLTKLFNPA